MSRKEDAIELMKRVMNGDSYLTYKEIAKITGYHEKYLLKLNYFFYFDKISRLKVKFFIKEGL